MLVDNSILMRVYIHSRRHGGFFICKANLQLAVIRYGDNKAEGAALAWFTLEPHLAVV